MTTPLTSWQNVPGRPEDPEAPAVHFYRAYGLVFASSMPVPQMTAEVAPPRRADLRPDVRISTGTVPQHLVEPLRTGELYEANAEQFLLRVRDVGRYLVSRGERILIEPDPNATAHEVRVFLLGSCLGVLLHQRGLLVLHASGIGTDLGAVLFAGASGAGKSTLLAELLRRGNRMIVDDVCAIRAGAASRPVVVPSYPRTRLWAETAERLGIDTSGLPRTRPQMDKYERQVPDQFWDREVCLARIYHLAGADGDEPSLTPLGPLEAFNTVLENTYRKGLLDGLDRRREHFELVSRAAQDTRVVRVIRPAGTFAVEELADLIMDDVEYGW